MSTATDTETRMTIMEPKLLWDGEIVDPFDGFRLRSFSGSDEEIERAVRVGLDPEVSKYFWTDGEIPKESVVREHLREMVGNPEKHAFFEIMSPEGDPLGLVALTEMNRAQDESFITVALYDKGAREQGVGTRAVHMLLSHARSQGFTRIFAIVDGNNESSVKIFGRLPVILHRDEDDPNRLELEILLDRWEPDQSPRWDHTSGTLDTINS